MTAVASRPVEADLVRAPLGWKQSVISRAWWLAPPVLALLLWVSLAYVAVSLPASTFRVYWKTPKFVDNEIFQLTVWSAMAFALASVAMTQAIRSGSHRRARGSWLLEPGFRKVTYRLFLLGMVTTFAFAVLRVGGPGAFISQTFTVLSGGGGSPAMRRAFAPVSGLTSLTQLGLLIAMIETINLKWRTQVPDRRTSRRRLIVVIFFGVVRSMLASERLAMAEIILPVLIVWARGQRLRTPRQAILVSLAPFIAIVTLLFAFAGTEYFRSYQAYKTRTDDSLMEFSRNRLLGYYTTALNNGALHRDHDTPKAPFSVVLSGILDWPGVRSTLQISDPAQSNERTLLHRYANPEFTNKAPIGMLQLEGGTVYVMLFLAAFGAVAGAAYAGFRFGSVGGSVWFGVVFTAVIEFPRIWYITSPRMSATMVVALLGWIRYNRIGKERARGPGPA